MTNSVCKFFDIEIANFSYTINIFYINKKHENRRKSLYSYFKLEWVD